MPLPAILGTKSHCRRQSGSPIGLWAGHCPAPTGECEPSEALPPAFTRGVPPKGGGGSNTLYRTPPVTALRRCQPPLKSGGRGYGADFWVSGRGTAPPGDFAKIALPKAIRKSHRFVGGAMPRPYRTLQYLHTRCRGGAVPLPAILQKSHCRRQYANAGGKALPPAFTRGVAERQRGRMWCSAKQL